MRERGRVSIIVPTRNSDRYLDLCLHCIVNQTYKNLEVIICDGASEDRTVKIIQSYQKGYGFIRYLALEDRGVSFLRNAGMEAATGDYLEFVDGDDFLLPQACEIMVEEIERTNADVVIAGFRRMMTRETTVPAEGLYEGAGQLAEQFSEYYSFDDNSLKPIWNKLYRKEKIEVRFCENLTWKEDIVFNFDVFETVSKIAVISDVVYEYNNEKAVSRLYQYREDGFDLETMVHERNLAFAKKYGQQDHTVYYYNYIHGMKIQMWALIHRSGWSEHDCKRKILEWMEHPAVKEMLKIYEPDRKADKILIYLIRHRRKSILYRYLKTFRRDGVI